ncbi:MULTISPECIES: DUF3137 domain-containing protein [Flagellimonas]|uniref:DUF3137 domain-containing protein n=1 Tax=Flagellimonas hadalis TaxID=2597517 RepID=A0A5N5IV37_9FLAO|nr:DUF3137 domain-containing protein [Allomuricauda hadalis]KAB5492124.1 DUF3137 domain-containing protein [Allomuricauda hadalis]
MQHLIQKAYSETSAALNDIYKKRKRSLFFQKVMWGVTGLYVLWMILLWASNYFPTLNFGFRSVLEPYLPTQDNPYANIYPIVGLLALLYPTTVLFARAFQRFKLREKETIAKMIKMLFPQVEFSQGLPAPIKEIVHSKLFAWVKKDTPIYSYGQIRGKVDHSTINIADIGIVEQNISNKVTGGLMRIPILNLLVVLYGYVFRNMVSNTSADNHYFTYRGMFCWLKFTKKLDGHTVVLPNAQMPKWDRLVSSNFKEEHKMHLEDPRFTKDFVVYGTDQVEARYVLSSSLMERIVSLKERFDRPLYLSFQDRQMYLAVMNDNGLFSFPSGKLEGIKMVEELVKEIETALEISEDLKL